MSFQSPWLLLSLLVIAVAVGIWQLAERRRMRYAVRYTNVDVLASVVSGPSRWRLVPPALFLAALAALLVSLARPEVERMLLKDRATVILVVDTSRSMQAEDVEPTRLGAAQEALRMFLDQAPGGLRVGLVVFAGEAQVATPPTRDHELVETAVDEIDSFLVYGGTAIGDALQTAVLLGRQITDLVPEEGGTAAPAPTETTRTLAQASSCPEEPSPVSI
ncbi:MAG: VWA domain-containing protein, partial [Gaiellaceae bacterium]